MDSTTNAQAIEQTITCSAALVPKNQDKPWLDSKGHIISGEELKAISKDWDQLIWEKYLDSIDVTLSDRQIGLQKYDALAESMPHTCFEFSQTDADDETKDKIAQVLEQLTPQQQKIIKMIFWEGRTERGIAKELRISRTTVQTLKKRSLRKLSDLLKQVSSISPLVRDRKYSLKQGGDNDKGVLSLAKRHLPKAS
jgi:RNA polymerase sigma factor (sigma-70 family)